MIREKGNQCLSMCIALTTDGPHQRTGGELVGVPESIFEWRSTYILLISVLVTAFPRLSCGRVGLPKGYGVMNVEWVWPFGVQEREK